MKTLRRASLLLCAALLLGPPGGPAWAAVGRKELEHCRSAAFSTEQSFMSRRIRPPDGNPMISDGDLLSPDGFVCARNADLLRVFSPTGEPLPDLGLDAVDVIDADAERYLVAFSTELDDPRGRFSSGDLLVTNGAVIPNRALLAPFRITYDIGLDEVKFIGKLEAIIAFLDFARTKNRGDWLLQPDLLQTELKRHNIDIWFSTERSALTPNNAIIFLDGDLLSAMGTIVVHQADLLPPSVPAGLPFRGVDFGLDAFAVPRDGNVKKLLFSTEIGYRPERPEGPAPSFTDGDVLGFGDGVVKKNWDLIKHFNPATNDLGLDALFLGETPPPKIPNIQSMCGGLPVVDFDGGVVPLGGVGTGLYQANLSVAPPGTPPRRPCGEYVPIDGFLPTGITKFRVAYRLAGAPVLPVGTASGVRTNWTLFRWDAGLPGCVVGPTTLNTDADGWMDAAAYLNAKSGLLTGCANSGLRLAVWDSNNHLGFGPPDREGHYVLWLEWEDGAGLHRERLGITEIEHHLQLDNTLPAIAAYPNGLQIRLPDGTTTVLACGEAPPGTSTFQVWAQFADKYYWNFSLVVKGGSPPASASYGTHNYYDLTDGPPGLKNTDDTGTKPDLTTVRVRDIDMTALGASFTRCCYIIELYVRDAAVRHAFSGNGAVGAIDTSGGYYSYAFITFGAAP